MFSFSAAMFIVVLFLLVYGASIVVVLIIRLVLEFMGWLLP